MIQFENQKIIEEILVRLTQMLEGWGLDYQDWLIQNKFFFKPYLHDHPSTTFNNHTHFHILINQDKLPKALKQIDREIIPPAGSTYLQDYLSFVDKCFEIQLFPRDSVAYKKIQRNCEIININNHKIQQLKPLNQFINAFARIQRDQKDLKTHKKKILFSSLILTEELATYLYFGYLYAKETGDSKFLKFIEKFYKNRPKKVPAEIINNIKVRGYVKLMFGLNKNIDISKKQILVIRNSSPKILSVMIKSGGIISEQGGITCHPAIVSREFNIPCAIGAENIYDKFREGDYIEINPKDKCIYILKPAKVI